METRAVEPPCPCTITDTASAPTTQPASQSNQTQSPAPARTVLHVWADPDNLPFSNRNGEGFENKLAELVAHELNLKLEYTWLVQHRGFFRESLKEGDCDLVLGVPVGFDRALTTKPYYRSTYAFVSRKDRNLALHNFDDPALRKLQIGIQLLGGDNPPPAQALGACGLADQVVGFPAFGHGPNATSPRMIQAVVNGDVDVAVLWGPVAGYFAKHEKTPLVVTPIDAADEPNGIRFSFGIAMGVRKKDKELRDRLNDVLTRRKADIDKILDDYGVPRVSQPSAASPLQR